MRRWILGLSAAAGCVGLFYLVRKFPANGVDATGGNQVGESSVSHVAPNPSNGPEGKANGTKPEAGASAATLPAASPALAGLDLMHIAIDDEGTTAPLPNQGVAHLSLDPELQRTAQAMLTARHLPEAAVVMVDPATG